MVLAGPWSESHFSVHDDWYTPHILQKWQVAICTFSQTQQQHRLPSSVRCKSEAKVTINNTDVNAEMPSAAYVQHVETVKQSGPWNSLGIWTHAEERDGETVRPMKQSRYSWLSCGYMVAMYYSRVKPENLTFKSYLTLKVNCPPKR